ncbi:MAG: Crp/Fnr family transcriptional regulator [Chromatiales bacterium]|nr:Crp/Fnr family transcriptional regulator [Chromatiales bacterium]
MSTEPDCDLLARSDLGRELNRDECEALAGAMQVRALTDGEVLVRQGERDSSLFLLAAGRLAVVSDDDGRESVVYRMKPGEVAGTRAFVDQAPRRATLRALGAAMVYTMQPASFEGLVMSHPMVVYKVMRSLFRIAHENLMRMNIESHHLANYIARTGGRH